MTLSGEKIHFLGKRDICVGEETLFEEKRPPCRKRDTFGEKETPVSVKRQFWRKGKELSLDFAVQLKWKRVNSI